MGLVGPAEGDGRAIAKADGNPVKLSYPIESVGTLMDPQRSKKVKPQNRGYI